MEKYYLERILQIVKDCESVQDSGESTYFKETEKQTAYDDIRDEVVAWERISAQVCGTCKYCSHEEIDNRWVCVNPDSEYCWTEYEDYCKEWEPKK